MLDLHATTWALKSAPRVDEENLQVPQGNELEATWSEGIVAWGRPKADGTERFAVFSSSDFDLDTIADETYRLVNEPTMFLNAIQYSLELHSVAVSLKDVLLCQLHLRRVGNGMRFVFFIFCRFRGASQG